MKGLSDKQECFCKEYIIDWNATRAAIAAGYSLGGASVQGHRLLRNDKVRAYIEEIQKDITKLAGVSALRNQLELAKMAYSTIASFKTDWMTEKDFDELTEDQRACISEIITVDRTDKQGNPIKIVKFKLHDKIAAIKTLNQMNGWNAPQKVDHTTKGDKFPKITPIMFFSTNEGTEDQ